MGAEGNGGPTSGVSDFVGSVKLVVVVAVLVVAVVAVSAGRAPPGDRGGFGTPTTAAAIFPFRHRPH